MKNVFRIIGINFILILVQWKKKSKKELYDLARKPKITSDTQYWSIVSH